MTTISPSRIMTWSACPRKYRLVYLDCVEWDFTPAALPLGTAVHAAVEAYYREHTTGTTLPLEEMREVFRWFWDREADGKTLDVQDVDIVRDQGLALVEAFHQDIQPNRVVAIEQEFTVPLIDYTTGEILPVELRGRIDLVEEDAHGQPVIVDTKTAARRPSDQDLELNVQLMAYGYAWRQLTDVEMERPVLCRIDAILKQKRPSLAQVFTLRTTQHDGFFVRLAMEVAQAIDAESFPPSPGWQCSGCQVRSHCWPVNASTG